MAEIVLYKYLSIKSPETWTYRRKLIADRELYFSDPATFNDPLDCNIATAAKLKGMLKELKVFCLSQEKRDDTLMFAHYGDSHRGFRLSFKIKIDLPIGKSDPLALGRGVEYLETLPLFDEYNIHKSLFVKSKAWAYEDEYRILSPKINLNYGKNTLFEVAFGYRMSPDFESVIRNWVKDGEHLNVNFYKASPSTTTLGFNYLEIKSG